MGTALGKLNEEKEKDVFYVYTVVKEDWKTGEQGKRTKEYCSNQPKLNIGGLYMHLGKGFPGCYRVLSVREEHDLIAKSENKSSVKDKLSENKKIVESRVQRKKTRNKKGLNSRLSMKTTHDKSKRR